MSDAHPIYRIPHPDAHPPSPAWWAAVRAFLDDEIVRNFAQGTTFGRKTAELDVAAAIKDVFRPVERSEEK